MAEAERVQCSYTVCSTEMERPDGPPLVGLATYCDGRLIDMLVVDTTARVGVDNEETFHAA